MLIGLGAIMALGPNMPCFQKAVAGAGVVFKLLDDHGSAESETGEEAISEPGPSPEHQSSSGHLELRNLSYAYPSRSDRPAISNISLQFARGTSTAVVGPSGAGKSTLISLLERWYEPTAGAILIDGHDISRVPVKWLRRQIALVQQEPQLFSASIFTNIAHGLVGTEHENASEEKKRKLVDDACREAQAFEFIAGLPQGLDTVVGNQGSLISGGQKQRIALARALVGQRPILLMDEATSALDSANSALIERLMEPSPNRTTIFISHKIMTAKRASHVVVMDKGSVAEQGTHEQLMRADGLYKRLHDTQAELDPEDDSGSSVIGEAATGQKWSSSLADEQPLAAAAPDSPSQLSDNDLPAIPKRSLFVNLWEIANEQRHFWPILLTGVGASVVTAQIFPVQGILLGKVLQSFQKPLAELVSDANFYSLMFFVVGLGALISYAILGFFMTLLGVRLTRFYRFEYFRAVLLQPRIDFFDRVASGTLASRLSSDPASLHDLISVNLGLLVSIFVSLISGSIVALAYSWKLGLVAVFGAMPFVFAAGFVRTKLDSSLSEATAKIFEDSAGFAFDALAVIRTVKAYTLEDTVRKSYQQHLSATIGTLHRQTAVIMLFFALSESVELLAGALTFWYGGTLRRDGELNTEQFFTVFISVVVGGQAAGALFGFSSSKCFSFSYHQDTVTAISDNTRFTDDTNRVLQI
jgi:ATP-binding cassette subfamily B (MDR/TAP) protein 1